MATYTQYWINLAQDWEMRGQVLVPPATRYIALFTVMPTQSTSGTELTTGGGYTGYARQAVLSNLTNWSGTQSDGSTTASSGTRTYISNNVVITFSASLAAAWPNIRGFGQFNALTGGNLLRFGEITDDAGTAITISRNIGDAVSFAAGKLRLYIT